jgi:hypothetical protein
MFGVVRKFVTTYAKNAILSMMPLAVSTDRHKRIRIPFMVIPNTTLSGSVRCLLMSPRRFLPEGLGSFAAIVMAIASYRFRAGSAGFSFSCLAIDLSLFARGYSDEPSTAQHVQELKDRDLRLSVAKLVLLG